MGFVGYLHHSRQLLLHCCDSHPMGPDAWPTRHWRATIISYRRPDQQRVNDDAAQTVDVCDVDVWYVSPEHDSHVRSFE